MDLRPNGIALAADGSFLIANLGDDGGVWRLDRSGLLTPVLLEVDGVPLPPANFVTVDEQDRIWISVSTRLLPRQQAWRADVADGFIVLIDAAGARIVADGLRYTNEVRPDPTGNGCISSRRSAGGCGAFRWGAGRLGAAETAFSLGDGFFPDGFAFDEEGGLWVTSLVSNRLLRFHRDRIETVLEDVNGRLRGARRAGVCIPLDGGGTPRQDSRHAVQQLTSVAFGGPDRRTVYLGRCTAPACIAFARTSAAQPCRTGHCRNVGAVQFRNCQAASGGGG